MGYRVQLTETYVTSKTGPAPELLAAWQGPRWTHLRQTLAHAARELHFVAYAGDSSKATFLLSVSERFAELALSIPVSQERQAPGVRFPGDLVDAKTLLAAHILRYDEVTNVETLDVPEIE